MKTIILLMLLSITACKTSGNSVRMNKQAAPVNLLKNGTFAEDKRYWNPWQNAKVHSNLVKTVVCNGKNGNYKALRIENPYAKLIGFNQAAKVKKDVIYKLSAAARSTITNNSAIIFGGRVGVRLPHQGERALIWMSEFNDWWKKEIIITNEFSGTAVVYIDMGYGGVVSTGEFADVRFEEIGNL